MDRLKGFHCLLILVLSGLAANAQLRLGLRAGYGLITADRGSFRETGLSPLGGLFLQKDQGNWLLQTGLTISHYTVTDSLAPRSPVPGPFPVALSAKETDYLELGLPLKAYYKMNGRSGRWLAGGGAEVAFFHFNKQPAHGFSLLASAGYVLHRRWQLMADYHPVYWYKGINQSFSDPVVGDIRTKLNLSIGFLFGKRK